MGQPIRSFDSAVPPFVQSVAQRSRRMNDYPQDRLRATESKDERAQFILSVSPFMLRLRHGLRSARTERSRRAQRERYFEMPSR